MKTVWQQGSINSENLNNLAIIREWWANINDKEITWQQRIITQIPEVDKLGWESQRFDEVFLMSNSEIRGITLYWRKADSPQERNTTPAQLILDNLGQYLYIFPQSQKELVIRVGLRVIPYQTISLINPQYSYKQSGENYLLEIRDTTQQLDVKITLSLENLKQLLRELTS